MAVVISAAAAAAADVAVTYEAIFSCGGVQCETHLYRCQELSACLQP